MRERKKKEKRSGKQRKVRRWREDPGRMPALQITFIDLCWEMLLTTGGRWSLGGPRPSPSGPSPGSGPLAGRSGPSA